MQLIGQAICHETFGKGVVTECGPHTLTVCFQGGEKKFLYPDAFSRYLTLKDSALQEKIRGILEERDAERLEKKEQVQKKQERKNHLLNLKIYPSSQAAFNLSEEQREEAFRTWSVSTGCYLSGQSQGKPRIPERMKPNSLCILTECPEGCPDRERRILGVFMAREDFLGDCCRSGVIEAHPVYRVRFSPEHQPLFWPYLTEEPARQRWGRSRIKYLPNTAAEQILFDWREAAGAEEQERAETFYQYYCKLNHLRPRPGSRRKEEEKQEESAAAT